MVQQCRQDRLFPLVGMQESVAKIAAVYLKGHKVDRDMIKKTYLSKITTARTGSTARRD